MDPNKKHIKVIRKLSGAYIFSLSKGGESIQFSDAIMDEDEAKRSARTFASFVSEDGKPIPILFCGQELT